MSIELTEHDWDSHKATIQSLYLTENRKLQGAGGVIQEMFCKYGFKATKAQFERHFKQWGFQKYKKRDIWMAVAPHRAKRKRDQKETEVWIGHERVPEKKLKKELARYDYDVAFPYGFQAPTPKTPEGLYIYTPAALQDDTALLYNLPWFQFLDTIESRISPYPDLAAVAISMINKSISNPFQSKPQDLETVGYMSLIPDTVISGLSRCATTANTPTLSSAVRRIHHRLRAVIPEDFERKLNTGHKDTSGPIKMTGNVQHLSLAVFLLTNNMFNTEKVVIMAHLFQDISNVQFLRSLLSVRNPTVEALAEKLLLAAIQSEHQSMVQTCLEAGADPNLQLLGQTALQYVAGKANFEITQSLLNAGADVNAPPAGYGGRSALQAAAKSGNIEIIQVLLNAGADVNAPPVDDGGRTALQAAAESGNIEIIQVLLNAGADVNAPPADNNGRTALQVAASSGDIEPIQVLLNAGADVNASAAKYAGATSLQAAALSGRVRVATVLLNAGANANADGALKNGRTALEGAAEHGRIDMVQLLLNAGVELRGNGKVQYERTLQLASKNGHTAVKRLVEKHYKSIYTGGHC